MILPTLLVVLLLVVLLPSYTSSFSIQTQKTTLYSKDGEHVIGSVLERKTADRHEVIIHRAGKDDKNNLVTIVLPYFASAESVGSSVWPSSLVAAMLWQDTVLSELTKDSTIIELGCGLGLGGLAAGQQSARCLLTDNDETVVEKLERHVQSLGNHFNVQKLDWRDCDPTTKKSAEENEERFDVCLGCDVAYYYYLFGPLINTIRSKLCPEKGTLCVVGQANRESQWLLYHHIKDGGYNQVTDEHEEPWTGHVEMRLYKLKVESWTEGDDGEDADDDEGGTSDKSVLPIAVLLYTANKTVLPFITPYDHVATEEDEKAQMISF